jgi:hypothetical protein
VPATLNSTCTAGQVSAASAIVYRLIERGARPPGGIKTLDSFRENLDRRLNDGDRFTPDAALEDAALATGMFHPNEKSLARNAARMIKAVINRNLLDLTIPERHTDAFTIHHALLNNRPIPVRLYQPTGPQAMTIWESEFDNALLVIVSAADINGWIVTVPNRNWASEIHVGTLLGNYTQVLSADLADQFEPVALSERARHVLAVSATAATGSCSAVPEPATAAKLANITGIRYGHIDRTINVLVGRELLVALPADSNGDVRYVPTVAGCVLLGDTLPESFVNIR